MFLEIDPKFYYTVWLLNKALSPRSLRLLIDHQHTKSSGEL